MSTADAVELAAYRTALITCQRIVVAHIGNSLADATDDDAHERAVALAQSLHEAGLTVDAAVDDYLIRCTDSSPEFARKPPSARRALYSDEPPF